VVDLCFIIKCSNKFFTTSFKNWGLLSKEISSGVPNQINIRSYRNHVTYCFTKDFKACIFVNFVNQLMATTMNRCPFLITSNGPIILIPHFSKGPQGVMGCRRPFIVDLCA